MDEQVAELLEFFKALADANRLKIIGLLAQDEYTVEEMAEILALRPSTVSHHMTRLSKAGLVSARSESYYNVYRLETDMLESMSQRILARETLPAVTAEVYGCTVRSITGLIPSPQRSRPPMPAA